MPGYDDTLVVTPTYKLLVIMWFRAVPPLPKYKPGKLDRVTLPACEGTYDISGYGYPFERYGSITIKDVADDFSALTVLFDGEEWKVPFERYVCVERKYEITDPAYVLPPKVTPERSKRMFGDYAEPAAPQQEHVDIRFLMYRAFEDIYQEAYYYLKLAEAGDVKAQLIIAKMLYDGVGIHKSQREAREWAQKAKEASGNENARISRNEYAWWIT